MDESSVKHGRDGQAMMRERTMRFALGIVNVTTLVSHLRNGTGLVADQLLRSGTAVAGRVAANYRAACRARSRKEFIAARIGVALEEAERIR